MKRLFFITLIFSTFPFLAHSMEKPEQGKSPKLRQTQAYKGNMVDALLKELPICKFINEKNLDGVREEDERIANELQKKLQMAVAERIAIEEQQIKDEKNNNNND